MSTTIAIVFIETGTETSTHLSDITQISIESRQDTIGSLVILTVLEIRQNRN